VYEDMAFLSFFLPLASPSGERKRESGRGGGGRERDGRGAHGDAASVNSFSAS